ncbi:HIRA-interacting protein 3-like isoform X1 [Zerene cesonia]|uniref:HIRA-interacting protein 3-like isoform X1 n=1 Tax=Zerene cesonia TaxID=33412 RepID=UPI0018E51E6B|nr:HIRA-interacting protein 3-like isoform X1 [Zerene cesonia]XP_038217501.1 HIRA-interacting protein 3-like isoform X1 [Zerene cesonia]
MNYEAERAMNQKRLRMEAEPGHGVVQGNGLPLNYIDNGHQIPYQPYAGAYNTHYPPPDAFAAYGPPPPGGYAPQNLSYAPPAHQNYAHHQTFPPQQQAQLHMAQSHMGMFQGYGPEVGVHKPAWPPQPHLLPPLDAQKPLDIKQLKPEIKLEPADAQKRSHPDAEMMAGDLEQPKIKIKTDIFKPDDMALRVDDKPRDISMKPHEVPKPLDPQAKDDSQAQHRVEGDKIGETTSELGEARPADSSAPAADKTDEERKPFSSPDANRPGATPGKISTPGLGEPKKRGRPKGSTNKPKPAGGASPRAPAPRPAAPPARPRAPAYQYAVRPFRKDFSGIQFRRRWSDDCLDSSHIPNEVYFGDVPVPLSVLYNYYDANAERERLASQAAHIAAQKAAAAKLAAAKLRGVMSAEVTTVDSSSDDDSSGTSGSGSEDSDDDAPLKRGPGRPKGSKNSTPKTPGTPAGGAGAGAAGAGAGSGRRGRPPVPPELRQPGITDMKKFCKAAGIRFDYKKLVEGCTKNKERVAKMQELLTAAGLEGKPTLEKCRAIKQAKMDAKERERLAKKEARAKPREDDGAGAEGVARRMTRGATGVKPRQRIVISSDEEDGTPAARRTLSKLRSSVNDDSD